MSLYRLVSSFQWKWTINYIQFKNISLDGWVRLFHFLWDNSVSRWLWNLAINVCHCWNTVFIPTSWVFYMQKFHLSSIFWGFTCYSFILLQFDGVKVRLGFASCQTQECSTLGIYLELKAIFSNLGTDLVSGLWYLKSTNINVRTYRKKKSWVFSTARRTELYDLLNIRHFDSTLSER